MFALNRLIHVQSNVNTWFKRRKKKEIFHFIVRDFVALTLLCTQLVKSIQEIPFKCGYQSENATEKAVEGTLFYSYKLNEWLIIVCCRLWTETCTGNWFPWNTITCPWEISIYPEERGNRIHFYSESVSKLIETKCSEMKFHYKIMRLNYINKIL